MSFAFGCKDKTLPLAERIQKNWMLSSVKENGTVVYTKGATNNIRVGYANWRLNLSSSLSATYTEFDGTTFNGQYELSNDTKLILKNLNPKPTGTDGTVEFTISDVSDTQMTLKRTSSSLKTGNSLNEYNLLTP